MVAGVHSNQAAAHLILLVEDERVNLSCTYDGDVRTLYWYRQNPGSKPEYLLLIVPGSKDESHERLKAKVDVKEKTVDLLKPSYTVQKVFHAEQCFCQEGELFAFFHFDPQLLQPQFIMSV